MTKRIVVCPICNGLGSLYSGPEDPEVCGGSFWAEGVIGCDNCGGSGEMLVDRGQFEIGAALRDKRERGTPTE